MSHPSAPQRERARQRADPARTAGGAGAGHPAGAPPSGGPPRQPGRRARPEPPRPPRSAWRRFTDRWGWRAYALPILVVLTVLALATTTNSPRAVKDALTGGAPARSSAASGPAIANPNQQVKSDDPGSGSINSVLPALKLPPGPSYTTRGNGTYATIPGTSKVIGKGTVHRFSIEVENGIKGVDLNAFAKTVMASVSNPQSWTADGVTALQRVDSGDVDFHVTMVSSMTVRQLCGYDLPVETSCWAPDAGNRVVLNVARWVRGAKAYASDLATYRTYAVNHEIGHALGHSHSHECLANGLAPIMMQQTIGTKTAGGKICSPNPWPYPKGVKDAPGPEEPGTGPDLEFFNRNAS